MMVLLTIAILVITICFTAALTIMPYISGSLISLVISTEVLFAKSIVPEHPFMNYCIILFVVEVIIGVLMHTKGTGKATTLCFSEIMVGIISMFILDAMKPDSIGYCVFVTLIYLIGNLVFLAANSGRYANEVKKTSAGIIVSSLIYAFAAYFILAIPAELLWQRYIQVAYPSAMPGFTMGYLVLRIIICGGIVAKGIMDMKHPLTDQQIVIEQA